MNEIGDLIIGSIYFGSAVLAFTFPCWGPIVAFILGAALL